MLLSVLAVSFDGAFSGHDVIYIGQVQERQERHHNSFRTIGEYFMRRGVEDFTSIVLLDDLTHLDTTLLIAHVHNVSISGNGSNGTHVYCRGNNSGLVFRWASNIEISGVSFLNCGSIQESTSTDFRDTSRSTTLKLKSALYFHYCTNISITSTTFEDNRGIGVVIYDSSGTVAIDDCHFSGNKISPDDSEAFGGGGGVHIEITSCPVGFASTCNTSHNGVDVDNSIYQIKNCTFTENNATTLLVDVSSYITLVPGEKQALGRGGGVYVGMGRSAFNVTVTISSCTFAGNSAVFGGGIFAVVEENARNNTVTVEDCNITDSIVNESGGGLYMLYASKSVEMRNNLYIATGITFRNNSARYHGGMFFMNAFKGAGKNNNLRITRCEWTENRAVYGAALGIATRSGISYEKQSIELESCSFSKNRIMPMEQTVDDIAKSQYKKAVMSVSFELVSFKGHTVFEDNVGSALWAQTSTIQFLPSTVASFTNNTGHRGGAVGLVSNSFMLVNRNSKFYFQNNTANLYGGAMFLKLHDERNPFSMADTVCPLQFEGEYREGEMNVSFRFVNNTAGISGNSIYFTTLDSCVYLCTRNTSAKLTVENVFKCIGEFSHVNNRSSRGEFNTFNYNFHVSSDSSYMSNGTIFAVPGRQFKLSVSVIDQLNTSVGAAYSARILSGSTILMDPVYSCVSTSLLRVYGSPRSRGVLVLSNRGYFRFSTELNITLLPCPPAYESKFIIVKNTSIKSCSCIDKNTPYVGIFCGADTKNISIYLIHGYWAGLVGDENTAITDSNNFFTSLCPNSFCSYNNTEARKDYLLPLAREDVEAFVCGPQRSGVLCGECRQNWSVFFHSPDYRCHPDTLCSVGWLFYIASELLPLTILFVSIIIFNISFTSGTINGFVLYAQTIDSLIIYTHKYKRSSVFDTFTSIYGVIYSFFNLNFFGIDKLSFCLLRGANALDIIALKYATVAFAIVLVAVTILVMKRCIIRKLPARFARDGAVTHGLSAFLILCYAQCTQVSTRLLFSSRLYGTSASQHRVLYNGEITLFSLAHLPYAVPALLCLVLIVFPLPIILLWHPLGKHLLSLCGLGESFFVRAIDKVLLVNKLKPLLDSFQSCFRDRYRYFAGIHFVYRLSLYATLLFGRGTQFYIWVLVHSAAMLLTQAILQPYKKKLHNMVDGLLFANLLFINIISLYIDSKLLSYGRNIEQYTLTASIVKVVLIYTPILCAVGWGIHCIICYIRHQRTKKTNDGYPDLSYRLARYDSTGPQLN